MLVRLDFIRYDPAQVTAPIGRDKQFGAWRRDTFMLPYRGRTERRFAAKPASDARLADVWFCKRDF